MTALIIHWLPVVLHVVGAALSLLGMNNFANAGTNSAIPMWAQIPMIVLGLLFHGSGLMVSGRNVSVAQSSLPIAPKGTDPVLHGLHVVMGLMLDKGTSKEELTKLNDIIAARAIK